MGKRATIPIDRVAPRPDNAIANFHTHPNRGGGYVESHSLDDIYIMKSEYVTSQAIGGSSVKSYVIGRQNTYSLSPFAAYNNIPPLRGNYGFYRYPFFHHYY